MIRSIKYRSVFFLFCLFLTGMNGLSQNRSEKKGNFMFDNLAYVQAIEIYEGIVDEGKGDEEITKKLGEANYKIGNYSEAAKWYEKLFSSSGGNNQESETIFQYGQSLKAIGKYQEADNLLQQYYADLGYNYVGYDTYIRNEGIDSGKYEVLNFEFNSTFSDYPAFMTNSDFYIVSSNTNEKTDFAWNNEPSSDIFKLENGRLKSIDETINTAYNEGSMAITQDGKTIYFTRNNYSNNKEGKDANNVVRLKLYRIQNENGIWVNEEELPFNSNNYSVGHPALSTDETKLYFVSDQPVDGKNVGTDIYEVDILGNGQFGTPRNLQNINSPGNEMFPFIASDQTLFFSSNGHPNKGGLDIFQSKLTNSEDYKVVQNLGPSINSEFDDFAFMINDSLSEGYFASNRKSTSDDIYRFRLVEEQETPIEYVTLRGMVKDQETGEPVLTTSLTLLDADHNVISSIQSNETGQYTFDNVDLTTAKYIRGENPNYKAAEIVVNENNKGGDINLISIVGDILKENAEILSEITIYFDFDKSEIRPDAKIQLQRVINMMKKYPDMKIDIASHTDSRGTENYNLALSDRRAEATINYITNYGISSDRLIGSGYGEKQLKNKCEDNQLCSEAEHQMNRRSEFALKFGTSDFADNKNKNSQNNTGLYYTVQVGVYANPEMPDIFKNIEDLRSEYTDKGYIKYSQGHYASVNQALIIAEKMHETGIPDAYVTAYYNGERITIRESIALLDKFGTDVIAYNVSE